MSAIKLGLLNVGGEDWKERVTAERNVTFNLDDLVRESLKLVGSSDGSKQIEHDKSGVTDPLDPVLSDGSTSG